MDLKSFLPRKGKGGADELLWTLVIEPDWVQVGIWSVTDNKTHVLSVSPPSAWELESELIDTTDAALSAAIQNLPEDIEEPSKAVFGVVSSWVKDGEIIEEQIARIKKICGELSLSPVGFVVLPEAISHFIKSEEGGPLSAVVLGFSKENIEMSVFRLGNLTGVATIARSVSVFDDVTEGLSRLKSADFPSRFILYNGKEGDLEDARQSLLKSNWNDLENLNLLHTPKIEIFESEKKIQAVSLAGASEMGDVTSVELIKDDLVDNVAGAVGAIDSELDNVDDVSDQVSPKELGFEVGHDVLEEKPTVPVEPVTQKVPQNEIQPSQEAQETEKPQEVVSKKPLMSLIKKPSFLKRDKTKKIKVAKEGGSRKLPKIFSNKLLLVGIVLFLALIVGGFAGWWFYPKASVTIYLSTKSLDEKIEILVDPGASEVNLGDAVIPGKIVTTSVSGDKTKSTTGTKTVGESAKGEVTLFRVGPAINLSAGTEIIGPNSLAFTLDEDTNVASGSAGSAGQTLVRVTASDLGAQYNLASGTTFGVENYSTSDIEAKNDSAFSGGSSRDIRAVSESDLTNLETDLEEELQESAKKDVVEKIETGQLLIEESINTKDSDSTFSNKAGDEADSVKLSMDLELEALVVDQEGLRELAMEVLKDRVPNGFVLRGEQIKVKFEYNDAIDGKYELVALVEANLLPEIIPNEVSEKIVGKYPQLVEDYLTKEIPGFVRAEIILKPKLPGRLGTLPHVSKNIEVEIAAER